MKCFYLFACQPYEHYDVIADFVNSYSTLKEAMEEEMLWEIGHILEMRDDGLYLVAEFYGQPYKWEPKEWKLERASDKSKS